MQNFRPTQRTTRKIRALKIYTLFCFCVYDVGFLIVQTKCKAVICLDQHPKFEMHINSKILFVILLQFCCYFVENVQNLNVRTVPLVKHFNQC